MKILIKGISRRWKEFRIVMIVTFIAAVFMSAMMLFQTVMNAYIMEQNENYYGGWIFASLGQPVDHPYIRSHGMIKTAGDPVLKADGEPLSHHVRPGYIDEKGVEIGRIRFYEGHMPEHDHELAADRRTLESLGCSYELGQEIHFSIVHQVVDEAGEIHEQEEKLNYTLCGVIKGFSAAWLSKDPDFVYPGLFLTEAELESRCDTITTISVAELDPRYRMLDLTEFAAAFVGPTVLYNSYTYEHQMWGSPELIQRVAAVMILIAVLAIASLLASYTDTRKQSYYRYRCMGMSRNRLSGMITAECFAACIPAALLGIGTAYLLAFLICRVIAFRAGFRSFFEPELRTILMQLAALGLTILSATLLVVLRMSDRRIEAGTKEYSKKQLRILAKAAKKKGDIFKHFPGRQQAVHRASGIAFILLTVLMAGLMTAAFWPITQAVTIDIPLYKSMNDFSLQITKDLEKGSWGGNYFRIYDGLNEEALEQLRDTAGVQQVQAWMEDGGHLIYWEGMEDSELLKQHYYEKYGFFFKDEDSLKKAEQQASAFEHIALYCRFHYTGEKQLQQIVRWIRQQDLSEEELEKWRAGKLLVVFTNNVQTDPETGGEKVYTDESLKTGDPVQVQTIEEKPLLSCEALVIPFTRMTKNFSSAASKYGYSYYGYQVYASETFLQKLEELEGKHRKYNFFRIHLNELASYEATDKAVAAFAAEHSADFISSREEKLRILNQDILQPIGVYGFLLIMTFIIYLILSEYFAAIRLERGREAYQRFGKLGLSGKPLQDMVFRSEMRYRKWILCGMIPGIFLIWLMNVKQFMAEKQILDAMGSEFSFYSVLLNAESANPYLYGIDNIVIHSGFRYIFGFLIAVGAISTLLAYFSARKAVRRIMK